MCTGIFIKTADNKFVFGRTLEFGVDLIWKQFCNTDMKGTVGKFAGVNKSFVTDGVNREGLFVGTFFFPHNTDEYPKNIDSSKINIGTGDVNLSLLQNCTSVGDVIKLAPKLNILETKLGGNSFSLHWIVCDKHGSCVVLEVKNKRVIVYDNPYNVITNSPEFPKQIENVTKYNYLSKYNKPNSISQGSGALGMPGDSSSLGRFVRAHFFRKNMVEPDNGDIGLESVLRILHNFDIPLGSVEDRATKELEVTEYTVSYCINDFSMKYASYGYVSENDRWVQTSNPVKKCTDNGMKIITVLFIIVASIFLHIIYNS